MIMQSLARNKSNRNLVFKWISRSTVLTLLVSSMAACTSNRPTDDNVAVNPEPQATSTVTVAPAPQPTSTVVISQPPQPAPTVVVTEAPQPTPTVAIITEPVTDVIAINTTVDKQTLANKQAQLTNVKVQSVVGDRAFWVGPSTAQRVFVLLAPKLDAGSAENKVVVKPGQTVDLAGVLKPVPSVEAAPQQIKGLNKTEAQALKNQAVYLEARNINFR